MQETTDVILNWLKRLPAKAGNGGIGRETDLIEQGVIDSIEILNLVCFLEERFSLVLPIEEFVPANFRTPWAVAALVAKLQAARGLKA